MFDCGRLIVDHAPVSDAVRSDNDLAGAYYTGGTTGFPKGVMLSRANLHSGSMVALIGFGMSGDACHITLPLDDGNDATRCMENALKNAGLNPEQVDYINAHGTSTPVGDLAETKAIKTAFGDHAMKVAVSSTKSVTGHLLGAVGGIEPIFSVLAIRDRVIPPTMNLENPGKGCDLDYVLGAARNGKINVVVSNSFGFGGTNESLVFQRLN